MLQWVRENWQTFQLVFTIFAIIALAIVVPWAEGYATLEAINLVWLLLLLPILFLTTALDAFRVAILLDLQRQHQVPNLALTFKTALVAQLPTGIIGAEVFRAVKLSQFDVSAARAAGALIICRIASMASLCLVGAIAALFALLTDSQLVDVYGGGVLGVLVIGGGGIAGVLAAIMVWGARIVPLIPWPRVRRWLTPLVTNKFSRLPIVCWLSITIVLLKVTALLVLIVATGYKFDPTGTSLAVVAGGLISVIPVTIAAIGARESGIAGVLILQGIPSGAAFSIAVLLRICAVFASIFSLVILQLLPTTLSRVTHSRD